MKYHSRFEIKIGKTPTVEVFSEIEHKFPNDVEYAVSTKEDTGERFLVVLTHDKETDLLVRLAYAGNVYKIQRLIGGEWLKIPQ